MSSISAWSSGSPIRSGGTGRAGVRRAGWPRRTMVLRGMRGHYIPRTEKRRHRRNDMLPAMVKGTGRSLASGRGRRWTRRLLLAGLAVGVPVAEGALVRRRAEPPSAPLWGRSPRYARRSGPAAVFHQLGSGPPLLLLHSFGPGYDAQQWRSSA